MGKADKKDLLKFLKPFPADVRDRALWLRDFVWDLYPDTNELIYDNYNALAFGWSLTDVQTHIICSVALGRTHAHNVHFGFFYGSKLSDPDKRLLGQGNQYRYILVTDVDAFPKAFIKKLLKEAYVFAMAKVKDKSQIIHGKTIVKSIVAKKRPEGKPKKTKAK